MSGPLVHALLIVAIALAAASAAYAVAAVGELRRFARRDAGADPGFRPPISVLKPVCGLDPGLHENLASFCDQDYPEFQVLFGVRDATDPAIPIIERVIAERPGRDLALVVDDRVHGTNLKVSNLENMLARARHPILVVADSDMRVGPDYLAAVVAPFRDPRVGAVTCLYRGRARGDLASVLGALFINEGFLPSVLVSARLRELDFCLGATMAVSRRALEAIGGLAPLHDHLADDHVLGRLVRARGLRVVLSPYVVDDVVSERGFRDLFAHELRWARTIRTVAPWGHAFSFVMHLVPVTLVAAAIAGATLSAGPALALVALGLALRVALHRAAAAALGTAGDARAAWLLPARDALSLAVWAASFLGRRVTWRHQTLSVHRNGHIGPAGELPTT